MFIVIVCGYVLEIYVLVVVLDVVFWLIGRFFFVFFMWFVGISGWIEFCFVELSFIVCNVRCYDGVLFVWFVVLVIKIGWDCFYSVVFCCEWRLW